MLGGVALRLSASIRPRACDSASATVWPPNSTSSQPSPSGSRARPSELMPFVRV